MTGQWEKTTSLIVGGAGFVGSNLAKRLLREVVGEIVIADNFLSSEPESIEWTKTHLDCINRTMRKHERFVSLL